MNEETTGKRIGSCAQSPGSSNAGCAHQPGYRIHRPRGGNRTGPRAPDAGGAGPGSGELAGAVARLADAGAGAVHLVQDGMFGLRKELLASLFLQHRLPAIATHREDAEAGILMAYGETVSDTFRTVASYVDKILKGAKPATCPLIA